MPAIGRQPQETSHGGIVVSSLSKTYVNGRLTIVLGDIHYCPIHGPNPMVTASSNVFYEGKKVCREGDFSACGGQLVNCSPDTFANG